jgi:hypothetical protein
MARRNGFDYPHTCSSIDKNIKWFEDSLTESLKDLILDISPYIPEEVALKLSNERGEEIFKEFLNHFEEVRKLNEDMRREAEHQIEKKDLEIGGLASEIRDLEERLREYE